MGKEIVYCSECGKIIREADFAGGKAATHEWRPYCGACRPVATPPPRAPVKPATFRTSVPPTAPAEPGGDRRKRILFGGGAAAAAAIVVAVLVLALSGRKDEAPPAPAPDLAAQVYKDLEGYAASSTDAEGILRRCGESRATLAGTAHERGLRRIEEQALRMKEAKEREAKLNALLETARKMQEGDPKFQRQDGVRALYDSALEVAGPRAEEIGELKARYERKAKEAAVAALPKEQAPAPAPAAEIPNRPPQVSITRPLEGATFSSPAEVAIVADASDPDGKVARVEFFLEVVKLGEASSAPFSITKAIGQAGSYVLTAKAIDDAGAETTSGPVTIVVTRDLKRGPFKGVAASVPGTIEVEDFDEGGEGIAYHVLGPTPKESPYRAGGVALSPSGDGGLCVVSMKAGEWLEYTIEVPSSGTYTVEVQAASKGPGGTFHVEFGKADKTGPLLILDTGGDLLWKPVTRPGFVLELGQQVMRLVMDKDGPSKAVGSFNSIKIEKDASSPETAKPALAPPKPVAKKPAKPDPFLLKVDEAIKKGTEYLKAQPNIHPQYKELVMLTFLHAGVPEKDSRFQDLLKQSLAFTNDGYSARTYNISLLAMALEEMDRVTYQHDLYKCAQFLVDNEAANGQWGYGSHTTYLDKVPTTSAKNVATPSKSKASSSKTPQDPYALWTPRVKPPLRFNVKVKPQRTGPDHGDNSNSQYAALGLRACHDGGIVFPRELVERARKWWVDGQQPDDAKKNKPDVPTGAAIGEPRGWGYLSDGKVPSAGYYHPTGSMTAGAIGGVCIYDYMLGFNWKGDPSVRDGMAWLSEHFAVTGNPLEEKGKAGPDWHYYYLYAIERVGMLYGTAQIGRHDWYGEGAKHLLEKQLADGSWNGSKYHGSPAPVLDTCYAILFLRRVTRPLEDVASVDPFKSKR